MVGKVKVVVSGTSPVVVGALVELSSVVHGGGVVTYGVVIGGVVVGHSSTHSPSSFKYSPSGQLHPSTQVSGHSPSSSQLSSWPQTLHTGMQGTYSRHPSHWMAVDNNCRDISYNDWMIVRNAKHAKHLKFDCKYGVLEVVLIGCECLALINWHRNSTLYWTECRQDYICLSWSV